MRFAGSQVHLFKYGFGYGADREHNPAPEPFDVDNVLLFADGGGDCGGYLFGGGGQWGRERQVFGHFGIDEAWLNGEHVNAFGKEPVAEAGQVGGEAGFGAAI